MAGVSSSCGGICKIKVENLYSRRVLSRMKRSAHVAGLMEISEISGNGKCILELWQIGLSTVSESSGAASSNEMPVPDSAKLLGYVL